MAFDILNDPALAAMRAERQAKIDFANTLLDLAADDELSITKINAGLTIVRTFMAAANGSSTNATRDQMIKIQTRAIFYIIRKVVLRDGR